MSLLMDALKKAEQEKKEAAKRLKDAKEKTGENFQLQDSETEKTEIAAQLSEEKTEANPSLESSEILDTDPTVQGEIVHTDTEEKVEADPPVVTDEAESNGTIEYSLTPRDDTLERAEVMDDEVENDFDDEIESEQNDKSFAQNSLSLEDNASAPFAETVQSNTLSQTETMDGSHISRSFVSAEALVRDMGSGREVPTPVAARTVFSAVARSSERRQFLEWMIFLGLVTVIIIATGSFYYLKVTPLTPETSSPLVAKGVETGSGQQIEIEIPPLPSDSINTGEIVTANIAATTSENTKIDEEPAVTTAAGEMTRESQASDIATSEASPAVNTLSPVISDETVVAEITDTNIESGSLKTLPDALPAQIPVDQTAIAISRSRDVSQQDKLIGSAYAAYKAGNYSSAMQDYQQVLQKNPESRDALLGLAAINYRRGDVQSAFENYLKVLKYYPKDPVAGAAVISIQGNLDPVRAESTIKLLISEHPKADYLYFVLGNIYAGRSQYADAQQAFFDAFRLNSANPDYAYNLAVSLDHLGQKQAALDYYNNALQLSDSPLANFDSAVVISRISKLKTITDGR